MSDRKISEFSSIAGAGVDVDNDYIEIVDVSAAITDRNKRITPKELIANTLSVAQSGTADSTTVQEALRRMPVVNIKHYGATEGADIVSACNKVKAAYPDGCTIYIPPSSTSWLLASQITTPDGTCYVIKGSSRSGRIIKTFSGSAINLGKLSSMEDVYLDGAGGSGFTGVGVMINTGANDVTSWRRIHNCDIFDTDSYGVEFSGQTSGYGTFITSSRIRPLALSTAAIKLPTVGTNEGPANRHFIGVQSYSNPLVDIADGENTIIVACDGGRPLMNTTSAKTTITGNRIVDWVGAPTWTIQGTGHTITGNAISLSSNSITFGASCASVSFKANRVIGATFTDNAGGLASGNDIDYGSVSYTPTWTADGTAPALGNGTISGIYWREGDQIRVNITFSPGSTTTFGTGAWHFSLPKTASRHTTGSAYAAHTGVGFYSGISRVAATSSTVETFFGDNKGNSSTNTIPFAWASTDVLTLDIMYSISG